MNIKCEKERVQQWIVDIGYAIASIADRDHGPCDVLRLERRPQSQPARLRGVATGAGKRCVLVSASGHGEVSRVGRR
jgi:hypothetical protein